MAMINAATQRSRFKNYRTILCACNLSVTIEFQEADPFESSISSTAQKESLHFKQRSKEQTQVETLTVLFFTTNNWDHVAPQHIQ